MSNSSICSVCGSSVDADGLDDGVCPSCQTVEAPSESASPRDGRTPAPKIPGYRIVRRLGGGGQGQVWQAIDRQTRAKVAIKILREDRLGDPRARARFEQEYETLAQLEHPFIPRVLARGELGGGELWHAVEYVSGKPLNEYVHELERASLSAGVGRSGALPLETVLPLFVRVCDALQSAHAVGVIHRDIKPTNVLVDSQGDPHVVDFGLARAAIGGHATAVTLTQEFLGSPAWASPEQVEARPALIDVRTDVYAIGLMLYVSLAGRFPYEVDGPLPEVFDQIRFAPRARASSFSTQINADLDAILLKALARDRSERYASAAELAEDLRRFLDGRPVRARGDSGWYRAVKFLQRNRAGVAVAAVVFILLIALTVSLSVMYTVQADALARVTDEQRRTQRQRELAERQGQRLEQTLQFMEDTLASIDPQVALGRDVTLRETFEDAAVKLDSSGPLDPLVAARLHKVLGRTFLALGEPESAERHDRIALQAASGVEGEDAELTLELMDQLGTSLVQLARYEEASVLLRDVLDVRRQQFAADPSAREALRAALNNLGYCRFRAKDMSSAEALLSEALALYREAAPAGALPASQIMTNLAELYEATPRYAAAEPLLRESLDIKRAGLPANHPDLARSVHNLGTFLANTLRLDEAQPLLEEAERVRREVLGPRHPEYAATLNVLGTLHFRRGDFRKAEEFLAPAFDIRRDKFDPLHPDRAQTANNLGAALQKQGRLVEAEPLVLEALDAFREIHGPDSVQVAVAMNSLADICMQSGQVSLAMELYDGSLDRLLTLSKGSVNAYLLTSFVNRSRCSLELNRASDALVEAEAAARVWEEMKRPAEFAARVSAPLATALLRVGRDAEAEHLYRSLLDALPPGSEADQVREMLAALYDVRRDFDRARQARSAAQ